MEILDLPPVSKFDASAFVTYQSEELSTPTERELIEDLPEWEGREALDRKIEEKESRPHRGVGFLRAESAPDRKEQEPSDESDFGEGLDLPSVADGENVAVPVSQTETNSTDGSVSTGKDGPEGRGRRRRRRGRRRRNSDDGGPVQHAKPAAAAQGSTEEKPAAASPSSDHADSKPRKKRRRRRGRRRKPGESDATGPTTGES